MQGNVDLSGGGSPTISSADTVASATSATSGTTLTGPSDTIAKSKQGAASSGPSSATPELIQAAFMLWSMGGQNSLVVQQLSKGSSASSVDATAGQVSTAEFLMQSQLKLDEICTNMLTAWNKSIQEQNEQIKREMKTEAYQHWLDDHCSNGYQKWLDSLSPEQRLQELTYPHLDKVADINDGISGSLGDYLTKIKTSDDVRLTQDLPFITAAVVTTGVTTTIPDTVTTSQILVQPIKDATDRILAQYTPNHASELGYLGAIMMSGSSLFALGQTLPKLGVPENEFNFEFAKNYAQKVLTAVNGSEFNTIAMALLTNHIEGSEGMGEERVQSLVTTVKVVLLSTALALLYKTESEFKGQGGGIKGPEFASLVDGNDKLADSQLKKDLVAEIRLARTGLGDNGDSLIAYLTNYVDEASSSKDLVNFGGILRSIAYDQEAAGSVFVA